MTIDWRCDVCELTIADGGGWLSVDMAAVAGRRRAVMEWERANPGPVYGGAALLTHPERVPWHVHHSACDPDEGGLSYEIRVEKVRTGVDLIERWLHLAGKPWLSATDWTAFVRDRVIAQLRAVEA